MHSRHDLGVRAALRANNQSETTQKLMSFMNKIRPHKQVKLGKAKPPKKVKGVGAPPAGTKSISEIFKHN